MPRRKKPKKKFEFMRDWGPAEFIEYRMGECNCIGGCWFEVPLPGETVKLANGDEVRADKVLWGAELAKAWNFSMQPLFAGEPQYGGMRSIEAWTSRQRNQGRWRDEYERLRFWESLPRERPIGSGVRSDAGTAQLVMPAYYAMDLYKETVFPRKRRHQTEFDRAMCAELRQHHYDAS